MVLGDTLGIDAGSVETIDGWTVRKFSDGYAECFATKTVSFTNESAFGSIYVGTTQVSLPSSLFIETPIVNITCTSWTQAWGSVRTRSASSFYIINFDRYTGSQSRDYCIHAIGRWK